MEITELIRDYITTKLLSNQELDSLEVKLKETFYLIDAFKILEKAPNNIINKLELPNNSCWQLCCSAILDIKRPIDNNNRFQNLNC
tara:strand:+ start:260 stop:517 length:258 start_codon:yes stop_codon:yes gene_type:complete